MKRLDPNNPTPGDELYEKLDGGISGILNKIFRVTAWDSKLKLNLIRYCFLPIMAVPQIVHTIEWYGQLRHIPVNQLIDGLPRFLYFILWMFTGSFLWLNQSGLLQLILVPLFAWGFFVTLGKLSKNERTIRQKVTSSRITGIVLNFGFLFMGVKYLTPSLQGIIIIMIILLAVGELFRIPALLRYQQQYGPLDVERFREKRKRNLRRQEKLNRVKNGRTKKKHGR
ncbi:hypothetical protein [Paenibacillus tyrfis]|uniref:hypothetical protein n=1 Tax=Paenibacillus tyrfis TaxID=1501230 RepID=UPI000B590CC8|nr:hypothetical protein [Paenibacillus tyrfis]